MDMYDDYLKSPYTVGYTKANELTKYLKDNLINQGIDIKSFNRGTYDELVDNPPTEIYEYQSFFLLEQPNGDLTLLDGFRRLLWYNSPNHNIQVRIYKQSDLTNAQIMKLLIYLNHFKFFGGTGKYFDRGFSLALKTIFGLNIPKYYRIFNAYLTYEQTKRRYSFDYLKDTDENFMVKERMLNPMFIDDMKFIETLLDTGIMMSVEMGALIYQYRTKYPTIQFDSAKLIKDCEDNKIIQDLQGKYKTKGSGNGAEAQKIVNQLMELYTNIFNDMFGEKKTLTYAEMKDEVKQIVEKLKKDKTMIKLTGNSRNFIAEMIFKNRLKNNIPINFVCVIHPKEVATYSWNKEPIVKLEHGILPYQIKLQKIREKVFKAQELVFGFTDENGAEFVVRHNYNTYNSGKKYTHIESYATVPVVRYDCDIFVDITKKELEEVDKNRFNYKY